MKYLLSVLTLLIGLVACTPAAQPSPTATPKLATTEIVLEQPTAPVRGTPTTANTATPIPPEAVPSFTPRPTSDIVEPADVTPTAVPDTADIPPASIVIAEPGAGSQVTSPMIVKGVSDSTFEQSLVVQVVDASGTEIAFVPTQIQAPMGERGEYEASIDFDVSEPTQAFILVWSESAMDGKKERLSSLGVTLLPAGSNAALNTPADGYDLEHAVITSPTPRETITGGVIHVEGIGRPIFENTLVVEVSDGEGNLIEQVAVMVNAQPGQYGPYNIDIPYQVTTQTTVRVSVRDVSPAYGGDAFVNSVVVDLIP